MENRYLSIGDQLDSLFEDLNLDDLAAFGEKSTSTAFVLAMVTIFQFAEDLPDLQTADAVRTRLDWKHALHLPLDYPGVNQSALSEFREQLQTNTAGQRVFRHMLTRLAELGLLGHGDKRRADAADVLVAVDALSRVEEVVEAMSLALEAVASRQPDWLRAISLPHWYERYDHRLSTQGLPSSREESDRLVQAVGADISYLLGAIAEAVAPDLALLPEVAALRRIRQQQTVSHSGTPQDSENVE